MSFINMNIVCYYWGINHLTKKKELLQAVLYSFLCFYHYQCDLCYSVVNTVP